MRTGTANQEPDSPHPGYLKLKTIYIIYHSTQTDGGGSTSATCQVLELGDSKLMTISMEPLKQNKQTNKQGNRGPDLLSLADLSHSMSNCHLSSTSLVSRHVITNTSFCTVHSNSHSATPKEQTTLIKVCYAKWEVVKHPKNIIQTCTEFCIHNSCGYKIVISWI